MQTATIPARTCRVTVADVPCSHHAASELTGSRSSYRTVSPEGAGFCRLNSTILWAVTMLQPLCGSFFSRLKVEIGIPVPRWMTTSPPMASTYGPNCMGARITENGTFVNVFRNRIAWFAFSGTLPPGELP